MFCKDGHRLERFYLENDHVVNYAVELYMNPPQAVTEVGYQAVVDSNVEKVRTEWVRRQTQLLVIAYNDPGTVVPIKACEQRADGQAPIVRALCSIARDSDRKTIHHNE